MEAPKAQDPKQLRTWIPCILATLLLFGLSSVLREITPAARLALAKEIPEHFTEGWETILDIGGLLWIPILLAAAWGFRLFWKGSRSGVLIWFLAILIVFSCVHVVLIGGIYGKLVLEPYESHERR